MVIKYMHENLKHTVKKHMAKKIKKYSHFEIITTNNRKHFFRFHIKQYWHFQRVTGKQYYALLQSLYQAILTFSESSFQINLW